MASPGSGAKDRNTGGNRTGPNGGRTGSGGIGDPRGYDTTQKRMNTVVSLTEGQRAVLRDQADAQNQAPAIKGFGTLLGAMPGMMGAGWALGQKMRQWANDRMLKGPTTKAIPGQPGGAYDAHGDSNRADYPGHNSDPGSQTNSDQTALGKLLPAKKRPTTLLGSIGGPLGTPKNPSPI